MIEKLKLNGTEIMPTKSIYLNKENHKFVETNDIKLSEFINDLLKLMQKPKAKRRFIKLYANR